MRGKDASQTDVAYKANWLLRETIFSGGMNRERFGTDLAFPASRGR